MDRSASGDNHLDLLVSRIHAKRFAEILHGLDFKETFLPREDQLPGVRDYYGYDQKTEKLVHVHAHFQFNFWEMIFPKTIVYLWSTFI